MFAWTSVQAIFSTPGVERFGGNREMGKMGRILREGMEVKLYVWKNLLEE